MWPATGETDQQQTFSTMKNGNPKAAAVDTFVTVLAFLRLAIQTRGRQV